MAIEVDLEGKVALVTGAATGVGRVAAELFLEAGAAVVVADIDDEPLATLAEDLAPRGENRVMSLHLDISDPSDVVDGLNKIASRFERLSIVVNNAAVSPWGSFDEAKYEDLVRIFAVNALGTMVVSQSALPLLKESQGNIVNLISDSARVGERTFVSYASSKSALLGFTKSLAKEVGREGVRVNGVSPGTTLTERGATFTQHAGGIDKLVRAYPLGRLGQPEDIANAVLFLASPLAGWITGQILSVNGGYAMVD